MGSHACRSAPSAPSEAAGNGGVVAECVRQLKHTYVLLRRVRRPHYRLPRLPKYEPMWERCARALIRRELDPTSYIHFVFNHHGMDPKGFVEPFIEQITSDRWIGVYAKDAPYEKDLCQQSLYLQSERATTLLSVGSSLREILSDPQEQFTPLFRYCLAKSEGIEDVAVHYRDAAYLQLQTDPVCREVYAGCLPQEMKNVKSAV